MIKHKIIMIFVLLLLFVKASFAELITTDAKVVSTSIKVNNGQMSFLIQPIDLNEPIWLSVAYRTEEQFMRSVIEAYNKKAKVFIVYDTILMEMFFLKIKEEN